MCGLAGFVNLVENDDRFDSRTVLSKMLEKLSARGPDGHGEWHQAPVHFGHTRLSIIDLSEASSQPLKLENDDYVIVFNGEIYNYKDLRQELTQLGEKFFSAGDTEVIVRGFKRFGLESIKRLNGMFAAAIWDKQNEKLTLFRDRFGIKPLYWSMVDGSVVFGSQIVSLLEYPGLRARLNLDWLNEYLTFQYAHGNITPFEGVYLLERGKSLVFKKGTTSPEKVTWAPERVYTPLQDLSEEQATKLLVTL